MEQLGNFATLCAQRNDVMLWMQRGAVYVCVGHGALSKVFSALCNDSESIAAIISELKEGAYSGNYARRKLAA